MLLIKDGVFGESVESKVVKSIPEKWWRRPGSFNNENHVVYGVQQSGPSISRMSDTIISKSLLYFFEKYIRSLIIDSTSWSTWYWEGRKIRKAHRNILPKTSCHCWPCFIYVSNQITNFPYMHWRQLNLCKSQLI